MDKSQSTVEFVPLTMALVLKSLYDIYDYYFNVYVGEFNFSVARVKMRFCWLYLDNRVNNLFMLRSPWPVAAIIVAYLYFVNGKGQSWMKDRKPFELNTVINVYNFLQIISNLYIGFGVSIEMMIFTINFCYLIEKKAHRWTLSNRELEHILHPSGLGRSLKSWPDDNSLIAHVLSAQNHRFTRYGK